MGCLAWKFPTNMTPFEAPIVQTFQQSIGEQLVAKDPAASQVLGTIITFKEIKSFPMVLSFFPKLSFNPLP